MRNKKESWLHSLIGATKIVSPTVSGEEWEEISPPTRPANTIQPQRAPNETAPKVRIDDDHCCICGKELDDGSTRLNGLQTGREAWIDSGCLKKLLIMTQSDNLTEFEEAARYMKSRVSFVDPDVSASLQRFIYKAENRVYGKKQE